VKERGGLEEMVGGEGGKERVRRRGCEREGVKDACVQRRDELVVRVAVGKAALGEQRTEARRGGRRRARSKAARLSDLPVPAAAQNSRRQCALRRDGGEMRARCKLCGHVPVANLVGRTNELAQVKTRVARLEHARKRPLKMAPSERVDVLSHQAWERVAGNTFEPRRRISGGGVRRKAGGRRGHAREAPHVSQLMGILEHVDRPQPSFEERILWGSARSLKERAEAAVMHRVSKKKPWSQQ
jgi:hypothetical protein